MAACSSAEAKYETDRNIPTYEVRDINSNVIHVGSIAGLWRERLDRKYFSFHDREIDKSTEEDAAFGEEMGISAETTDEIKMICRKRKKRLDYREETLIIDRICRNETYANEVHCLGLDKTPADPEDQVEEGEIILTMNILYPIISHQYKESKPLQTIQVLGSQKLTQLRDALCCVSDLQISGEFSNTPDLAVEHVSKDHFKSAYFYFEGVIYNDMRYPECKDLSKTILEWVESRERGYDRFQTAKMEDTTFNDLRIKIGYPYLYCHQGDCEHVVIITDIRIIHQDDCLDKTAYPLLRKKHWILSRKCAVCKMYIARWVTNDDCFAPADPCYFCDLCFRMLHYDSDGNKLGEFLAYPYVDPGIFN
ncbi:snRNA-activating protein complex subunit 3 isoform X2 [Polyodon spathula]|uniref:snRNA-activating protein complex subunit 3 isoform X2 n=1 Tax=Polyodon spathula TaxID=7913 RepID=UPI001B7DD41D|nr:snRNA-activating protein complex subunit 3 isoform X2 [Polyodon spathula]